MKNNKYTLSNALILFVICIFSPAVKAGAPSVRKGFSHTYPTEYKDWANGFLAGNGKMGVIVFGNPLRETVIFNDRKFFMATSHERSFNKVGASDLRQIREYCAAEQWKEANDLANAVHGWKNGGEGDKHPGYDMQINIPEEGTISNYLRECDFRTGEITVKWTDNRGDWERKTFVSRKDNVIVQYLKAPSKGKLNCDIRLNTDPGMHFIPEMKFTDNSGDDCLNLRVNYPSNTKGAGYEGVTKVIVDGGEKSISDGILTVKNARSVLLLTRMEKYYGDCETQWNKKSLQAGLSALPGNYNTLLAGQIKTHQAIFDRVRLDLCSDASDRVLSNEDLLKKQKNSDVPLPALWERLFDSGRYLYLSSSSETSAPDLLGLWTGDCHVGWSGYYHLDANLNLQIAGGNIGNMPEAMEGYFSLMERLSDGFRINADKLLGCRGLLGGGNTAGLNGLISALSFYYPYQYVTGEMGWLLYPFWEHYQVTGDETFLRQRLFPLLKEMGAFYEDFLVEKDANGKYIFAGSISPENQPAALGFSLVNNSTFDIAGARFCMEKLIFSCKLFNEETGKGEGVERWSAILEKLPPYLVNSDGALSEWSWPSLKDRDNYGHRHSSHLITVWPLNEISKEKTPALYDAARMALDRKDRREYEDAGHGILHSALHAANLNNSRSATDKLLRMMKNDFFFISLASAHYSKFKVFCTDVCNTVPAIMMEMLVNSKNDVVEWLPALPASLPKGAISGLKTRNRITVNRLEWDMTTRTIRGEMTSDIDQDITLIQRNGITSVKSNAAVLDSPVGKEARILRMKAGKRVWVEIFHTAVYKSTHGGVKNGEE